VTAFIDSFATQQLLPPWRARGVRTWGFAIRLDRERVEAYLEKYFNGGYPDRAPYRYEPLPGPQFGLFTVADVPEVASHNPGTLQRLGANPVGWDALSYLELYLGIPVLRRTVTPDKLLVDPKLVWVQPFVFCNNPTAVFSSREIWGTDVNLATMTREAGPDPAHLHIDTAMVGIKAFSPRSITQLLACVHIQTGDVASADLPTMLKANPDLERFVSILGGSGVFADHAPPAGVGESPFQQGVELDNLKQFRDCFDMGAAIYRAIVASKSSHSEVDNIVFFDPAQVDIDFLWSDSIAEVLKTIFGAQKPGPVGPPAGHVRNSPPATVDEVDWDLDSIPIKAELAFSFTSNVDFEVIGTLYTYGAPR